MLECPASAQYNEHKLITEKDNEYTVEGTVGHYISEQAFLKGCDTEEFLDRQFEVGPFTVTVDDEMVTNTQIYVDLLNRKSQGDDSPAVEMRVHHPAHEDLFGTIDFITMANDRMTLCDLKYGVGVDIQAYRNIQLSTYAIMASYKFGYRGDVDLVICQPRGYKGSPIREWTAPRQFLDELEVEIHNIITGKTPPTYKAGDHCGFCPGKVICPELYQIAEKIYMDHTSEEELAVGRALEVRNMKSALNAYMTACDEFLLEQAEEGNVPGFRLVPKFGHAKWNGSDAEIEEVLRACPGVRKKDIISEKLVSPAQARKIVGKELVAELSSRPETGKKLVAEVDDFDDHVHEED